MSGQSPSESGPRLLKLAFIATTAGAFSGLFGVGGGTVIVPLLVLWFAYPEHAATGTSLAAIVLIGLFAAIAQGTYGNVDLGKGILVGVPAVGGVLAGTALQQRLSGKDRLAAVRRRARSRRDQAADRLSELAAILLGFMAGALAGLVGVGGGILFVPTLVFFLDQSQIEAEATSLVAIVLVAIVGSWRQYGYGNVQIRDALVIGLLSPAGVVGGTVLANNLSQRALEVSFACLALFFAAQLVRRSFREPAVDEKP